MIGLARSFSEALHFVGHHSRICRACRHHDRIIRRCRVCRPKARQRDQSTRTHRDATSQFRTQPRFLHTSARGTCGRKKRRDKGGKQQYTETTTTTTTTTITDARKLRGEIQQMVDGHIEGA